MEWNGTTGLDSRCLCLPVGQVSGAAKAENRDLTVTPSLNWMACKSSYWVQIRECLGHQTHNFKVRSPSIKACAV